MANSTKEVLLEKIDKFIATNDISEATFGKLTINDTGLVNRLRSGGDITTTKLDAILRFLTNPNQNEVKSNGK